MIFYNKSRDGSVLVLKNFEYYFVNYFDVAINTLNLIDELSWIYLLFGKKLIVLLNCNNNMVNQRLDDMNKPLMKPIRWIDDEE